MFVLILGINMPSAGLTLVANAAIPTALALLAASRSFVLNLFFVIWEGGYWNLCAPGKLSYLFPYILHMIYLNFIR